MRSRWLAALVFCLGLVPATTVGRQEQDETKPPATTEPPDAAQSNTPIDATAAGDDDVLTVDEMKALSDEDLLHVYLEEPWRLAPDFGEDDELMPRLMELAHPEPDADATAEAEPETPPGSEPAPEPKPKPKTQTQPKNPSERESDAG